MGDSSGDIVKLTRLVEALSGTVATLEAKVRRQEQRIDELVTENQENASNQEARSLLPGGNVPPPPPVTSDD